MPSLTVTPLIQDTAKQVLLSGKVLEKSDKEAFRKLAKDEGAPLPVLQSLLKYSQDLESDTPKHLYTLLKGSVPYHYIPPPKPRVILDNELINSIILIYNITGPSIRSKSTKIKG